MGKVLQQAVAELTKLPEPEQEAAGAWILAELESEHRWDDLFAGDAPLDDEPFDPADLDGTGEGPSIPHEEVVSRSGK